MALSEGIRGAMARLLDQIETFGDLSLGAEVLRIELAHARERDLARITFVDGPSATTRREAGAGVQDRAIAEVPGQSDQVLTAEGVDLERLVERRVEVDHASHVDDGVDLSAHLVSERRVDATQGLGHISENGRDLLADEALEVVRVGLPQGLKDGALEHDLLETLAHAQPLLRPHDQVHVANVREARKEQRAPDFPQKARAADDPQPPPR